MTLVQHLRRTAALSAPMWRVRSTFARPPPSSLLQSVTSRTWSSTSRFGGSSDDSASALRTQLSVCNSATVRGRLHLQLPLPGLAGLSAFHIDDATQTVEGLLALLKKRDAALKTVDITTPNGTKLARTVSMRELTGMDFILRLNHVNVLVQHDLERDDAADPTTTTQFAGESAAFASVRAVIETDSRPVLPLAEYYRICLTAGAEEPVANKWLRELQRRNLVTHFNRSTHAELQNAIILRPQSPESIARLEAALDSELSAIRRDRKLQEAKRADLESELKKAIAIDHETRKAAQALPNAQKWLGLSGVTTFYGGLMYLVWDVYSWDVMEPITYFIGFTAVLGSSFYHTITKKDPTFSNMWHKKFQQRLAAIQAERKFHPTKVDALHTAIAQVERDIATLAKWEGVTTTTTTQAQAVASKQL